VERTVNAPDATILRLRDAYRRLNASFGPSFAFRFGRGRGFCAEMLGLVKTMMICLHLRSRLCLSKGGRARGVGVVNGFGDYFLPIFPEADAGVFNVLNAPAVRGSSRFPVARRGVSRMLRAVTGVDRFMMDDLGALPSRLVVPELGLDAQYWDACALLVDLLWIYQPDVGNEILDEISRWDVPREYVSVHVRRGDKNLEGPYAALDGYVEAIDRAWRNGCTVVIASDDAGAATELARRLPDRFRVVSCSAQDSSGYDQRRFNRLSATERYHRTKRFLAELEVLRRGELFVGSAGSNVTNLIEMMRAGRGVLQVK
jgi:hypothetical protein